MMKSKLNFVPGMHNPYALPSTSVCRVKGQVQTCSLFSPC